MSTSESEILTRMRRRIILNFLDLPILLKLKNGSLCDQDIVSYIPKRFNVLITPGTVYSCLHHLEEEELVKTKLDKKKKVYILTEKGEQRVRTLSSMRDKVLGLVLDIFLG